MGGRWFTVRIELVSGEVAPSDPPRPGRLLLVSESLSFRALAHGIDTAFSDVIEIDWIDTPWDDRLWDIDPRSPQPWEPAPPEWMRPDASMAEVEPIRPPEGSEDLPAPTVTHAFTLADGTRITPAWDGDDTLLDEAVRLARLRAGETFVYEPDADGGWRYACTVGPAPVVPDLFDAPETPIDPVPGTPLVIHAWGALPEAEDAPDPSAAGAGAFGLGAALFGTAAGGPWDEDGSARLRRALDVGDVIAIVALLAKHDPMEVAHHVGPTLARALADGHPGAREAAVPLVGALAERGWPGDEELAADLAGVDALDPSPVDLATLAAVLDGPGERSTAWRLDVETGRLTPPPAAPSPGRTIPVVGLGPRPALDDLLDYVGLDRDGLPGRMADSAPRELWDPLEEVLLRSPEHRVRWTLFAQERRLGRARRWLAEQGLRPVRSRELSEPH
jgi:hypothetical protein